MVRWPRRSPTRSRSRPTLPAKAPPDLSHQQQGPDPKALAAAADEVRSSGRHDRRAHGTLVKARDTKTSSESLTLAVKSQAKAVEHLGGGAQVPTASEEERRQGQGQGQAGPAEAARQGQEGSAAAAGRRRPAARDQDAKRQRDRRDRDQPKQQDPVDQTGDAQPLIDRSWPAHSRGRRVRADGELHAEYSLGGGQLHVDVPFQLQLTVEGFDESPAPELPKVEIPNATVTPIGAPSTSRSIQIVNGRRHDSGRGPLGAGAGGRGPQARGPDPRSRRHRWCRAASERPRSRVRSTSIPSRSATT